ncbi:MAG: helix-turn-helix domain-containing protein [Rikenellaceae bacterium]
MKKYTIPTYHPHPDKIFIAEIDSRGEMLKTYSKPLQSSAYLFVLCCRGECRLITNMSEYVLTPNRIITILPNSYIHVTEQSENCRLYLLAFDQKLMNRTYIFSSLIRHLHFILESPMLELDAKVAALIKEYVVILIKANKIKDLSYNSEFVTTVLHSLFSGLGGYYKVNDIKLGSGNRGAEIVKSLVQQIVKHYPTQRSPAFYADLLRISPQHLSTTVSKVTGKKVTDIIAQMVIIDAQTKLRATEMSVQEIAQALSFPDISVFGKYFKRYTGLSPRQYREIEV